MDNLPQLTAEEKRRMSPEDIPNSHVNQTISKVIVPPLTIFAEIIHQEAGEILRLYSDFASKGNEAYQTIEGNNRFGCLQVARFGLDVGVEALNLALNMFPGVYTIDSCNSVHKDAWVRNVLSGELHNPSSFASFVCDDPATLAKIEQIIERGAVGIKFECCLPPPQRDSLGNKAGFLTIDYYNNSNDRKPMKCRVMYREINLSTNPYDTLDSSYMNETEPGCPPYGRFHMGLFGCIGLAVELFLAVNEASGNMEEAKEKARTRFSQELERIKMLRASVVEMEARRRRVWDLYSDDGADSSVFTYAKMFSDMVL